MPTSNTLTFTVTATPATLTSLTPASRTAGGAAFTLTVGGTSFDGSAVVHWGGTTLTTTVLSATQVTAPVTAAMIASVGTVTVTVVTTGGASNGLTFAITASSNTLTFSVVNVTPTISSIAPTGVVAGAGNTTITVTGTNFMTTSVVQWNGTALATTYVSTTTLTAVIPSTDLVSAGTDVVTVLNP